MSEYSVDVGLNVQPGQYLTSMGQAIAVTQEYANVVDGIPGSMAKMASGLVGLANKVTGFSAVNTLAVDSAASYQKAMSGIEARSAAAGKSFTALEKTTKQFARNFPGGMGQSVQVIETLQKQGVKSERQIESLGKAWIKLGAATGTSAAQMGADFTQLSRTMGNGADSFAKLSDSLVSVTSRIGGSADSVVAFSKALAPVAATVGMNQTSVMGLSAAMSTLGEDGYRSANVLNKVMLDMNRAVRDGGPELKAYADVMGTTADNARALMKANPTEFFTRLSESLGKAGPEMSRQLEALGFDSVRDTRSLSALTRSGNLRESIETARRGFGDGSTERAAEKALGGVTDQAEKLKEAMSQVVANAGRPLLGVVEGQLRVANSIAGGAASATEGKVPQVLAGAAGIAGGVANVGMNALTLASVIALARIGGRAVGNSDFANQFRAAGSAAYAGQTTPQATTRLGSAGRFLGAAAGSAMLTPQGAPMTAGERLAMAGKTMARTGAGLASFGMMGMFGGSFRSAEGKEPLRGAANENFRAALTQARASFAAGDWRTALATVGAASGRSIAALPNPGERVTLPRALRETAVGAARMIGGGAMMGASAIGKVAGSIMNPYMMGALAAAGTGMYAYQQLSASDQRNIRVGEAGNDLNASFNSFAEAMGLATRGLESFSASAAKAATAVAATNRTTGDALTITDDEAAASSATGYKAVVKSAGDATGARIAAGEAVGRLGFNAKPEEIAAYVNDLSAPSSLGKEGAQQVADLLRQVYGAPGGRPNTQMGYELSVEALNANSGTLAGFVGRITDAQESIGTDMARTAMGEASRAGKLFGGSVKVGKDGLSATYADVVAAAQGKQLYDAALKAGITRDTKGQSTAAVVNQQVTKLLGFSEETAYNAGMPTDSYSRQSQYGLLNGQSYEDMLAQAAKGGDNNAKRALALISEGYVTGAGNANYGKFTPEVPVPEKAARDLDKQFTRLSKASGLLTDSLYEAEDAARALKKPVQELTAADTAGLSEAGRSVNQFTADRSDASMRKSSLDVLGRALAGSGGKQGIAQVSLELQGAMAEKGSDLDNIIQGALRLQEPRAALANAGRTQMAAMRSSAASAYSTAGIDYSAGNSALNDILAARENERLQWQTMTIEDAVGMNRSQGALQTSIAASARSAGLSASMIMRDTGRNEEYSREDLARQSRLGRRDLGITEGRARRDFGIQQGRARADYDRQERYAYEDRGLQEVRANRDFNKQMLHADEDYQKSRTRALEDNGVQRYRAQRDFDKQMERAQRDFDKGQDRGLEDFNRSRLRATEDFGKQMSRMVEDQSKQMYDPWKRIQAQMVLDAGQLLTNLKDQTAAVDKQVANLAEARGMGLSEQAIRALSLADAGNAQQLSRIVEDMRGNGSFTGQINAAVGAKQISSDALVRDQGNTAYARATEDFGTSMKRMEEDFTTSKDRALADFDVSRKDTQADFTKSMDDSQADFDKSIARMDADYATSTARAKDGFAVSMSDLQQSFDISRKRTSEMFLEQVKYAGEDQARMLGDMNADFDRAQKDASDSLEISVKRMWERARLAISDAGAQAALAIRSMQEQFYQVGQSSPEGAAGVVKTLQDALGSGIDPKKMGEDWQNRIQNALDYIKTNDIRVPQRLLDFYSGKGFEGVDYMPAMEPPRFYDRQAGPRKPTYDESDKASMQGREVDTSPMTIWKILGDPGGDDLSEKWKSLGLAAWKGFAEGFAGPSDESLGLKVVKGFIQAVKDILGIKSPSTVFAEIGRNVVEGLRNGIADTIGGVWEKTTDPIKDLDIGGKVEAAFATASAYLRGMPGRISGWVGAAWDGIKSPLGKDFDLKGTVETAFSSAKEWLGGLVGSGPDSVQKWVGDAWDKITAKIPSLNDVMNKVKAAFGLGPDAAGDGIAQWIQGLKGDLAEGKDTVTGWIGDAWGRILDNIPGLDKVKDAFRPFGQGIVDVVNALIGAWNGLQVSIPIPDWAKKLAGPQNGQDSISFGTKPIKRVELNFADGGIATRQTHALIGEAGYPEAVIPLNQRGAEVLAATMARYVDKTSAQGAMVSGYSTPITNNYTQTYDQRTQFTGPITVESQSPDDLARQLQARARRQRLAQPIGRH